jgi:DNA-binding GntR family transcriptional regulator
VSRAEQPSNGPLQADASLAPDLPLSLTEFAIERIRGAIVDGALELGQQISEAALSTNLGISKTPVREALVRLQSEGLVVIHPRRGTFVFTMSEEELAEICECRLALERAALQAAMGRSAAALADALAVITAAMDRAWEASDALGYRRLDSRFHLAFFEHCANRYLLDAYQLIAGKMAALRTRLSSSPDHVKKSYVEHINMAERIRRGDLKGTLRVLDGHIGLRQGSYWGTSEVLPPRPR